MTNSFQDYKSNKYIPPVYESEEQIAKDAPKALAFLKMKGLDDLVDILGLSQFAVSTTD